ncbi:MAG: hypothetical protein IH831_04965 [Planctomycetes bacterium]|nr:hypothetical protein [Planctomycetota bacterium]
MFTALNKTHAYTALRAPLALMLVGGMGVFLLAAVGCRTARDNQFDILERELRTQEDYIYELEDYVVEYSEKLRQCRRTRPTSVTTNRSESKSIVKTSKPADEDDWRSEPLRFDEEPLYKPGDDSPKRRELGLSRPRTTEPPAIELEETILEELEVPELEISEPLGWVEGASTIERAVYNQDEVLVATDDEVLLIPEPVAEPELESTVQDEQVVTAERVVVAQLFRSEAGKTPPKTLLAVVEARNADDESVKFSGEVSLMVMTGDSEQPQRLKRWDFKPEDAASAWQSSHLGDGFHLELPLGETKLPDVPLELWVRIVSQEGRKLLAQVPFEQKQLAALEVETGAQELLVADAVEGRLRVAEEPIADEQADQRSGWQSATQLSDMDWQGYGSTIKKTSGWISQPAGGRFPHAPPTMSQAARRSASAGGSGPVWTTGRVDRTGPTAPLRGSQPQWSPLR